MKATLSKDGQMRFTIRVAHRISTDDIVDALGWHFKTQMVIDPDCKNIAMAVERGLKPFKSRKALLKLLTQALSREGDSMWAWSDGMKEEAEKIREQGRVLVLRKFPELKTPKTPTTVQLI